MTMTREMRIVRPSSPMKRSDGMGLLREIVLKLYYVCYEVLGYLLQFDGDLVDPTITAISARCAGPGFDFLQN